MDRLGPLLEQPSFTSQEARGLGVSASTLAHYVKSGDLTRVGHGIYRKADRPVVSDFRWEDLVEAVRRVKNGVVCLASALALYEITEETPRQHWIAIAHGTRHRAGGPVKIVRMRNIELGKTTIEIDGVPVPIFDRERTIVDSFRYLSRETAIKALRMGLKGRSKIDLQKTQRYAKTLRVKIDSYLLAETTI